MDRTFISSRGVGGNRTVPEASDAGSAQSKQPVDPSRCDLCLRIAVESRTYVPGECPRLCLFAAVLIAACSQSMVSKTTVAQHDRMPGYEGAFFTSLLVIGVGENDEERRFVEDVLCRVLSGDSAYMLPSWKLLPESRLLTETELKGAIATNQFDGVLTMRLVSVDEDEEHVEGKTSTAQRAPPFEGYYQSSYGTAERANDTAGLKEQTASPGARRAYLRGS